MSDVPFCALSGWRLVGWHSGPSLRRGPCYRPTPAHRIPHTDATASATACLRGSVCFPPLVIPHIALSFPPLVMPHVRWWILRHTASGCLQVSCCSANGSLIFHLPTEPPSSLPFAVPTREVPAMAPCLAQHSVACAQAYVHVYVRMTRRRLRPCAHCRTALWLEAWLRARLCKPVRACMA